MSEPHQVVRKGRYITFSNLGPAPGRLTNRYRIDSEHGGVLGFVRWWGGWRKYVLEPGEDTVFEETCLREIAAFCADMTKQHRAKRKAIKAGTGLYAETIVRAVVPGSGKGTYYKMRKGE